MDNYIADGPIEVDSPSGKKLGLTADVFYAEGTVGTQLYRRGAAVYIQAVEVKLSERGKGNFTKLLSRLWDLGFTVKVPNPFPAMCSILRKKGFSETIEESLSASSNGAEPEQEVVMVRGPGDSGHPFVGQMTDFSCGLACLEAIGRKLGRSDCGQAEVLARFALAYPSWKEQPGLLLMGEMQPGEDATQLFDVARDLRLCSRGDIDGGRGFIRGALLKDDLVGLVLCASKPTWHHLLVYDATDENVLVMDPSGNGEVSWRSWSDLEAWDCKAIALYA